MSVFSLRRSLSPVGLDVGADVFRAAQLKNHGGKLSLLRYGSVKVPMGVVADGEITDVEAAAKSLQTLWKNHKIPDKHVVLGVANQKVVARLISMPQMDRRELRSALQYQAQDYIPIPVEEAILDFDVVGEYVTDEQEHMMEILLVAAQRDMIENHIAAVEGAGLRPVAVDVSSLAFARVLLHGNGSAPAVVEPEEALALINVSAGITNIVVLEGHVPRFTRICGIAGTTFTDAIAERLNLTFGEAEELKNAIGLPSKHGEALAGVPVELRERAAAVQEALVREMDRFVAEIRRSLDYYLAQAARLKTLGRVVITGSGVNLRNFVDYLAEEVQLPCEVGHPLNAIQPGSGAVRRAALDDELSLSVCVGLAMRGFEQ